MIALEQKKKRTRRLLGTVAMLFLLFSCFGLTGTALSLASGRNVVNSREPILLNSNQRHQSVGPFEITEENRPHKVVLKTSEIFLPLDSWAVVEVSLQDAQGNTFYLFSEEFWHEDGRDSDGYWEESDTKGSFHFRPDAPGEYTLELSLDSTSANVTSLGVETSVKDRVLLSWPFVLFTILTAGASFFTFTLKESR